MNNAERSYQIWNRIDLLKGDISLNSLADKIGVKYQRMKEQRSSGRVPSADDLYRIAKALNSTMEYIYAGEGVGVISEEARLVDDDPCACWLERYQGIEPFFLCFLMLSRQENVLI